MEMTNPTINIFSENIYSDWQIDEKLAIDVARKILEDYLTKILEKSCLNDKTFDTISFDILYTNSEETHRINKEYRKKDYAADIITFAIFADTPSEEQIIFDGEINLGEIIIALDKIIENASNKNVSNEQELYFMISHGIMHLLGFDHQSEKEYNFVVSTQNDTLKKVL